MFLQSETLNSHPPKGDEITVKGKQACQYKNAIQKPLL